ncbi:hypothetical protein M9458_054237, partial [Cirrhinus mrigala]
EKRRRGEEEAKQRYGRKLESQLQQNNSRSLWQGLRTITDYKAPTSGMMNADVTLADELNTFYARFEAAAKDAKDANASGANGCRHEDTASTGNTFIISEHDVRRAFKRVNTRKAAGPDGISGRILRACADQLAPVFTEIFNLSLSQSVIPTCFKESIIVPVPKKPHPASLNDYRPVALTSVVMKCFERLVKDFIISSLPDTLDPLQFAYRPNRSTDDAISHLLHTSLTHLDTRGGNYVKMLFIDYSSAFNTIIPSTLTTKLEHLGLSSSLCQWICNFLTGRPQAVRMGGHLSASLTLSTGAPQGCVLSPLLYSLYTYDCVATTSSTTIIKFADDTVVVGLISDNNETAYLKEIRNLENWCQRNNLLLNVSKTKELIVDFSTKQERNYQTPIINESPVERVNSFKYLGVHITQDLSWSWHINTVVKKARRRLYHLRRLRDFRLPSKVLRNFYSCTIESILTGNILTWFGNSTMQDRRALQRVDLEGLVTRLPDIHEGAGKWIRLFEEETVGKLLAVGDIKALLAKTVGGAKMEEILQTASLDRAVNSHNMDGIIFDAFRPAVWQALRAEYPIRLDPKSLKGDELKETENPTTYFQRQLKRWKQETEGNPETDPLMATLLRQAVIDAMPPAVKCRLEDVVGLNSKTHKEFCDHVSHAVEQFRKNEQKLKNQEKELQRKLTQLQLEELTKKNKKKIQASVMKEEAEQIAPPPTIQPNPPTAVPLTAHSTPELCSLAMATALDDATVNSLFWIGANYYHPVDLADTTGLNWREEILWCQESVRPQSRTSPPAHPEPSQPTPRLAEPEPRATEPSPMGVTVLSIPTRCESRSQCSRQWMFQTAPPTAPLRLSLELSACLDFPPICYLLLSALLPQTHHRCPLTAPLLTLSPPSVRLHRRHGWRIHRLRLQSWTLTRPFDPAAPPWLSAPSSPPSPVGPPAPPGSIIPPAAPWSVVVPPSPQDSTPPAAPRRSVGVLLPPAPTQAPPWLLPPSDPPWILLSPPSVVTTLDFVCCPPPRSPSSA